MQYPPILWPGGWYQAWCPCGWYADWPFGGPTQDRKISERQAESHDYSRHMPLTWRMGPTELEREHLMMRLTGSMILSMHFLSPPEAVSIRDMEVMRRWHEKVDKHGNLR